MRIQTWTGTLSPLRTSRATLGGVTVRPGSVRAIEYEIPHRNEAPNLGLEHAIFDRG